MEASVLPPKRVGPASGRQGWQNYVGEHHRVVESERARDSSSDSRHVERVVADLLERRSGIAAEQSRRLRDDPGSGRVGPGGTQRDAPAIAHEDVRLGGSDATRLQNERQERIERHARPYVSSNARPWNTTSTIPMIPVTRESVHTTLPPVHSQPQRRWRRDEDAVRQAPLSAGPARSLIRGAPQDSTARRALTGVVGPATHSHVRTDTASLYLSPESLRA